MESVLENVELGNKDAILSSLIAFNDKNKINFKLKESVSTREKFCGKLIEGLSSRRWLPRIQAAALSGLRIAAREKDGSQLLRSMAGFKVLSDLSDLSADSSSFHGNTPPKEQIEVIVEAVKCLCNLILTQHTLTSLSSSLRLLRGLSLRLKLVRNVDLPHDIITFDLRLLFLITACGTNERAEFREKYDGLHILLNLLDWIIFGDQEVVSMATASPNTVVMETAGNSSNAAETGESPEDKRSEVPGGPNEEILVPLPPNRGSVGVIPAPLSERRLGWVAEAMKVVFNQTVHWKEEDNYDEEEIELMERFVVLIRILLVSIPFQNGKPVSDTITHCVEVLVNMPLACAPQLLLPLKFQLKPPIRSLYSQQHQEKKEEEEEEVKEKVVEEEDEEEDELWEEKWNMVVVNRLLRLLIQNLDTPTSFLPTILTVLRNISKGCRNIRRFLKNKILPPLREVRQRPEQENSLKGRLVKLMTNGAHSSEAVVAEFLFVLCKEDASRLIKYTGYGNAAGLLLTHGLLGGGKSANAGDYSSDSGSDTDDYVHSKPSIDPVTGGPNVVKKEEEEEKEEMTEEEKEREAAKLVDMMRRLNEQGIIKVLPMDSQQQDILNSEDLPLD